jgi:hypothetical protein
MVPAVHMLMGVDEASVIEAALELLDAKIEFDLDRWEDKSERSQSEFLSMLSIKFTTENMRSSLSELLSSGAEDGEYYDERD